MTREAIRAEQDDAAPNTAVLTRVVITAIQDDTVTVTLPGGASVKAPRISGNVYSVGGLGWTYVQEPAVGPVAPVGNAQIQGPKGDKGDTGQKGDPGAASTVAGPKGDKGDTGATPSGYDGFNNIVYSNGASAYPNLGALYRLERLVTYAIDMTLNNGPQFGSTLATLPQNMRPPSNWFTTVGTVYAGGWAGVGVLKIDPNGAVSLQSAIGSNGTGMEIHGSATWKTTAA